MDAHDEAAQMRDHGSPAKTLMEKADPGRRCAKSNQYYKKGP